MCQVLQSWPTCLQQALTSDRSSFKMDTPVKRLSLTAPVTLVPIPDIANMLLMVLRVNTEGVPLLCNQPDRNEFRL